MGYSYIGRSPATNPNISVFIATPTFVQPTTAYTFSLANTTAELVRRNINFQLGIPDDVKNVDDGRNMLVEKAREGNCTHLLFIDGDQRWMTNDVVKLLSHSDHPIVAGAYRFKHESEGYPVGRILGVTDDELFSMSFMPTGFMLIRLDVFDELDNHPELNIPAVGTRKHYFMRGWNDNTYDGGDVMFCRRAIKAGFKVLADPSITIGHIGYAHFDGSLADYLNTPEGMAAHTAETKDKNISASVGITRELPAFEQLADAYGNKPWAAPPLFLKHAYEAAKALPKGSRILECGSGLTTLVLAMSGHRVVALKEHGDWAEKTDALLKQHGLDAEINVCDVAGDWFKCKDAVKGLGVDMLVIDGPRRRPEVDRLWPVKNGVARSGAVIMADDASNYDESWTRHSDGERIFASKAA